MDTSSDDTDNSLSTLAGQLSICDRMLSTPPLQPTLCLTRQLHFCTLKRELFAPNPAHCQIFHLSRGQAGIDLDTFCYNNGKDDLWLPFRTIEFIASCVNVHFQYDHTDIRCYMPDGSLCEDDAFEMDGEEIVLFIVNRFNHLIFKKSLIDTAFPSEYTTEDFEHGVRTLLTGAMMALNHTLKAARGTTDGHTEVLQYISTAMATSEILLRSLYKMPPLFYHGCDDELCCFP